MEASDGAGAVPAPAEPSVSVAGPSKAPSVALSRLRLAEFRNYRGLEVELEPGFVVLAGENGAGKTNFLEAVSLLTPGRGLRRASYGEILREGASGFSVRAGLVSRGEELDLLTIARAEPGAGPGSGWTRSVRINETTVRSAEELLDHLRILWLTPAMDGLFTGPAGDRRRFLDRLVLAVDPAHGRRAADYERAMRSRNRLLQDGREDDSWLSGLETQLAELGVAIASARSELVRLMSAMIDETGANTPFPQGDLDLSSGYDFGEPAGPAVDLEDEARARLSRRRGLDRAAGRMLEGPHRADLSVRHRAKNMPAALSSTGEQKALLIGLVLAHARLVSATSGLSPILLLDEIAAHLDPGRRAGLFDIVEGLGVQCFMTGTDASLFEALGRRAQMLPVSGGRIAA